MATLYVFVTRRRNLDTCWKAICKVGPFNNYQKGPRAGYHITTDTVLKLKSVGKLEIVKLEIFKIEIFKRIAAAGLAPIPACVSPDGEQCICICMGIPLPSPPACTDPRGPCMSRDSRSVGASDNHHPSYMRVYPSPRFAVRLRTWLIWTQPSPRGI